DLRFFRILRGSVLSREFHDIESVLAPNLAYEERAGLVNEYEARRLAVVGNLRPGFDVLPGGQQGLQRGPIDFPSAEGFGNLAGGGGVVRGGGGQEQAKATGQQQRRPQLLVNPCGITPAHPLAVLFPLKALFPIALCRIRLSPSVESSWSGLT